MIDNFQLTVHVAASWIICGLVSYASILAFFSKEYALVAYQKGHRITSICVSVVLVPFGPWGLLVAIFLTDAMKHGLLFWPMTRRQLVDRAKAEYPQYADFIEEDAP